MFQQAIVRTPGPNFAQGLTTVDLGMPDYRKVLQQHGAYCEALAQCGLQITTMPVDPRHPDSTFVEDTAVLTAHSAILCRPGATSRAGEVAAIRSAIANVFPSLNQIEAPGTLDGGDICEADNHFYIGLSHRTNEEGARQLAIHLERHGYTTAFMDVRRISSILHLKSGISYIGDRTLVVIPELAAHPLLHGYKLIQVAPQEAYAANCVRVNQRVLVAAGYRQLTADLRDSGFDPLQLDMSEIQKMDGGLSCLSLRF